MSTGNGNNGNNRYGNDRNSGKKTVRKVENTRFYERENPENNMRRVGRPASDFDESRKNYSSSSYDSGIRSRTTSGEDNIPEYKSFKKTPATRRTHTSDSSEPVRESRYSALFEDSESKRDETHTRKRSSTVRPENEKLQSDRKNVKKGLYGVSSAEENSSDYDFDASKEETKARRKAAAAERLNQKREKKKADAEIVAKANERSSIRRAISKKRAKKIRSEQLIRAAIFVFLIFAVLLVVLTKCDYDDPFGTAYVTRGSIEFMTDAKVSFIREESVCKSPATGILVPAVNEGDKVSAGSIIAYITTKEQTALIEQLNDVEEKIKTIQKLDSTTSDVMSADLKAIDKELENLSRKLAEAVSSGNMEEYSDIKNQIDALSVKRNALVNNSQSESSYLTSLLNERDLIKQRISIYTQPVVTESAGIVSFNIDGNESSFTEMCKSLSADPETGSVNVSSVSANGKLKNLLNSQVAAGDPVAKVITSNDYYVAAVADGNVTVQTDRLLSVKSKDRIFSSEVDVVSVSYSAGKTLIVGKTSKSLVSSLGERTVDADMITGQYEGMKIPLSSLTEFDSTGTTARLTLVRSDYVVYAYVNILAKDDEYAIISDKSTFSDTVIKDADGNEIDVEKTRGVTVNDIFVLKPEFVKEGEIIS
ncbi:MAG: hypothetical protein E7384_06250 [Ruminococcaceae bacterium]|nr:hypothetical protein [Oscillospiraceae bacterium]